MKYASSPTEFADVLAARVQRQVCRAQARAWKAQQKAVWRAQRDRLRAEARALRYHSPVHFVFGMFWAVFWISLLIWLVFGGPEARNTVLQLCMGLAHWVRDAFVNAFGLMQ